MAALISTQNFELGIPDQISRQLAKLISLWRLEKDRLSEDTRRG